MVLQIILLIILLVCAVSIVVAVTVTKTSEDGLSGTIVGGSSDTYYGKDKGAQVGRKLFIFTMIASIVFAAIVLAVYVIQPDYTAATTDWTQAVTEFESTFHSH